MQIELLCPACRAHFVAPPHASAEQIRDRMTQGGQWYALGEGETFEDMIFSTLTEDGAIFCPECGAAVSVSEESLGRLAMEVLSCW
jgi:hypothetical protein